jgi:hypothetical protein
MRATITIQHRFRGPARSGNGGYTCGLLAGAVPGAEAVEVTLRVPPPLERALSVEPEGERLLLLDDGIAVAEARAVELDVGEVPPVAPEEAAAATTRYAGFDEHPFPECFVCGPAREVEDGLRIFAGPVPGREHVVAAPWRAREVVPELVWAVIDCPGAFAVGVSARGETVLGRMTARIERLPRENEPCVAVGWPLGEDGRKLHAATALLGDDSSVLAVARQVWIVPRT